MDASKKEHASLSIVDLFSIGIGPSSSHTVGPMRAAFQFVTQLDEQGLISDVKSVKAELFGSLALTGKGHASDKAILLGLSGQRPRSIDPDDVDEIIQNIKENQELSLLGLKPIGFDCSTDLIFDYETQWEEHANTLRLSAFDSGKNLISQQVYFSVGGGFIVAQNKHNTAEYSQDAVTLPYPFSTAEELIDLCRHNEITIAQLMRKNECAWRDEQETAVFIKKIHKAMNDCIDRGCQQTGILPGGFNVPRRAHNLWKELTSKPENGLKDPLTVMDWVNLYALAVNEENASGGRVVTAPTNGAAGIIPAVLRYYERFCSSSSHEGVEDFLLTAAAIGVLYKKRASISGAEVGCQGEVGVACSMAAGGLTAALGGSLEQIENAAEIGMEHNLGLTCDPVGGLVQIPCIERNAMGAMKAINAARLALKGDGTHLVSLDKVIKTMHETGMDMKRKYKETSQGGLAVNIVAC